MTPASKHQLNLIVILLIYNDRYVLLIYFFPHSIAFTSVTFYLFLLQTTDSTSETNPKQPINLDVDELMRNARIGYSLYLIKMIEKDLKKIKEDILRLLFAVPQTNEIKAKVDGLVKRLHDLQVSCKILNHNINSFSTL